MQDSKQKSLDNSTRYLVNARIREFCEYKNLKQADLERLGINKSTVSMVWKNKQQPGIEFIQKLALGFGILNIDWLLTGRGKMLISYKKQEEIWEMVNEEEVKILSCKSCRERERTILAQRETIETQVKLITALEELQGKKASGA